MLTFPPGSIPMFLTVSVLLATIFSVALLLTPKPKRRWIKVTGVVVSLAVFGLLMAMHWYDPPMYQVHSEDDYVLAAFAPDGQTLFLGGSDKIQLWDTHSHRKTGTFGGHSGRVRCLAFNPEGNLLASSGGTDKTVKLWRWPSGDLVATFESNVDDIGCLEFRFDGEFIAVAGSGPPILELRSVETGEEVIEPKLWFADGDERKDFKDHFHGGISDLAFSPDGKSLALAKTSAVFLCDLKTGEVTLPSPDVGRGYVSVTFDPQGRYLAASDNFRGKVDLWDLQTKQQLFSRNGDGMHVAFGPDGKTLASADYGIQLWDVPSGKLKAEFRNEQRALIGHRGGSVTSLVFSPDGKTLVTGGDNGALMLWDVESLIDGK